MVKYKCYVTITDEYVVHISASSEKEAERKARKMAEENQLLTPISSDIDVVCEREDKEVMWYGESKLL